MTALGINNPNSKWMREYNGRNGGVDIKPAPVSFRSILNREWTACMVIVRPLEQKKSRTKAEIDLLKKMNARMGEIAEQLELLNLCDFIQEFDAEDLRIALQAFDTETAWIKAGVVK
jgi:predicted sugar kinase